MSSAAIAFVHATLKRSQKVARFGSLGWIPMIQVPFHSSCVALQLQNGSAHAVGASYSGLYEEGEVEHINVYSPAS